MTSEEEEQNKRADAAFDALSNWYENSLKEGCGFKSEQERQEYIKSLGDPMKHPMFAETTEDLEGHPLTEAFRCLREEDKSLVELANMYKEEGNEWIKKGNKKSFLEAYERYSHALSFIDKAIAARNDGNENESDATTDVFMLKSQLLSNRAMSSLSLTNFGSCRRDCDIAVRLWPLNIKAHYRRCKALHMLRYYPDCIAACNEALLVDACNKDVLVILGKCEEEFVKKREERLRSHARLTAELSAKWDSVWSVAQQDGVALGYYPIANLEPQQLRNSVPYRDESGTTFWPMLALYPQYNNFDIVQAVSPEDLLVEHLAVLFPEKGDYEQRIEWDAHEEYQASNVVVYLMLQAAQKAASLEQWRQSCTEHHIVANADVSVLPLVHNADGSVSNSHTTVEEVRLAAIEREKEYDAQVAESRSPSRKSTAVREAVFLELHLGCTIGQILRAKGHVVAGGILTLLVFPRDNAFHKRFVTNNLSEGNKIELLAPIIKK